jgi:predicted nucleotidyltransferase
MLDLETIPSEVEPIFARHDPVVLAYLFGSAARGETHRRSDLDFAVLLTDAEIDAYCVLWIDLHAVLSPQPFDLVILNHADPVLCFEVVREGRAVFRRSDEALNDFERRAWHRYQDTRHLRAIGNRYLRARAQEWSSKKKPSTSA